MRLHAAVNQAPDGSWRAYLHVEIRAIGEGTTKSAAIEHLELALQSAKLGEGRELILPAFDCGESTLSV